MSEGVLSNRGDGKLKNYVFIVKLGKEYKQAKAKYKL